ncbi:hypothetical protein EDC19_1203 [Natranaerovirga hydrolytica]|uniref:Peptidase M16C associated domain-containing protein n=1 Tax=Natranaerovirga hydrolytica TaxID=680378 RepID=A0A4R1MZJ4_9FIRM|nr:insulinase family protein [Natranaerovirga hydrolytica]TCK98768.1 hypothetical protein EDC19_1203 [Natranaerovirga hydrolytica]
MGYEMNKAYHGFTLVEQEEIQEINSVARVFEHHKSGAKALLLSNEDTNKVFSVNFRTPPHDETGLPHILEHSVLCGSKKFPSKDPFVELAKGSLNTFLNAMTFSDKTMYPIASCNDKDFQNLMHVYMDAVFYPNIYKDDNILKQEGWHYELNDMDSPIEYKGVVYNEMKGVFSSPEQVLFRRIQSSLFPDTPYAYESGGDPDYVTDLTKEDFIEFHKKYYHPSNSYIFLYGDFDIDEKLKWLNKEYLNAFDAIQMDSSIPIQAPFDKVKEKEEFYSISNNEDDKDKTYLSYNYVVGTSSDPEVYYGFDVLEHLLLEAQGAPLKKALIDAEIGKDIFGSFDNSILQPTLSIVAKNANPEDKDKFVTIIQDTLEKIVKEGLDKKKIEAAINYHEFKIREADFGRYPKGVIYAMQNMDTWLYDQSPLIHFKYNPVFEKLREGIDNGYFEGLIEKYLLNNTHASIVMVKPEKGLTAKKENEVKKKLKAYKDHLSQEEKEQLIQETKDLIQYQEKPSSKADLEKIPLLDLKDIKKEPLDLPLEVSEQEGVQLLHHNTFTNNIGYVKYLFDTKDIPTEMVPYLGLLSTVLGKVNTKQYTYDELERDINIHTGGIIQTMNVYGVSKKPEEYVPKFEVKAKAFVDKIPVLFKLVEEILLNTTIEDKKRLKEILLESRSRLQMNLNSSGHVAAANRATSYFSKISFYKELIGGITYYNFISTLVNEFDEKSDEIIDKLNQLIQYVFRKENLIVCFTGEDEAYEAVKKEVKDFSAKLYDVSIKESELKFDLKKLNEGFLTPGKIQYVAKAGNFIKEGFEYSGHLKVLQTLARLDYLWNNVRVKGGAYGVMCSFSRTGNTYITSYRDPNLKQTIDVYNKMVNYIENIHIDDRDMTKYIIGTISSMDADLTPYLKGETAVGRYMSEITYKDLQKEREEVLSTKEKDIKGLAELVDTVLKQDNLCVLGNENKLESNKELFGELKELFND